VNCQHCAALVELLMVELDGSLHTCPDHILARVRRSVVDERWCERMQAPADVTERVPEIIEDPPPRAVSNPPGRERYLGEL
jgi:hypothetical protein